MIDANGIAVWGIARSVEKPRAAVLWETTPNYQSLSMWSSSESYIDFKANIHGRNMTGETKKPEP